MNKQVKKFIEENVDLIENNKWEKIYINAESVLWLNVGEFTDALLACGINPLELGLNYIPNRFFYCGKIKEFIIPNNVTSIGNNAFYNCSSLTSIEIPDSITSIGSFAFYNCNSLTNIDIPNSVINIGYGAFSYCSSLISVTIPESVTSIGEDTFHNCNSLTSVKYLGTKKEAMQLGIGNPLRKSWRKGSNIKKIICSDEVIEL